MQQQSDPYIKFFIHAPIIRSMYEQIRSRFVNPIQDPTIHAPTARSMYRKRTNKISFCKNKTNRTKSYKIIIQDFRIMQDNHPRSQIRPSQIQFEKKKTIKSRTLDPEERELGSIPLWPDSKVTSAANVRFKSHRHGLPPHRRCPPSKALSAAMPPSSQEVVFRAPYRRSQRLPPCRRRRHRPHWSRS